MNDDVDPGVPEALPRTLRMLADRLGLGSLDRLWIFPPLAKGRQEWGLVAVSRYPSEADSERRTLFTVPYTAERSGRNLTVEHSVVEEGDAPPDRLPRVMDGVVRRSGDQLGDPREIEIAGDPEAFEALMSEFDESSLDEPTIGTGP